VAADNDHSTSKRIFIFITAGSYDSFIVNCGKTECLIQKYSVLFGISHMQFFSSVSSHRFKESRCPPE